MHFSATAAWKTVVAAGLLAAISVGAGYVYHAYRSNAGRPTPAEATVDVAIPPESTTEANGLHLILPPVSRPEPPV